MCVCVCVHVRVHVGVCVCVCAREGEGGHLPDIFLTSPLLFPRPFFKGGGGKFMGGTCFPTSTPITVTTVVCDVT